jgi:transcriptional regulator with XRE-family HTH domain
MDLKSWRKKAGLTQSVAGELLGLSQPSFARIESGEQWPNPETIALIEAGTKGAVRANDILAHYQAAQKAGAA